MLIFILLQKFRTHDLHRLLFYCLRGVGMQKSTEAYKVISNVTCGNLYKQCVGVHPYIHTYTPIYLLLQVRSRIGYDHSKLQASAIVSFVFQGQLSDNLKSLTFKKQRKQKRCDRNL